MDGLAQSEYEHCTASVLQGPRHTASCPLACVVGCVLLTCAQGLAVPNSHWLGEGESKWPSSGRLVLLLLILVSVLLVSTWIHIRRGHCYSCQRLPCSTVHFPSQGRARWVGERRWRLSRRRQFPRKRAFHFPCIWGEDYIFQGKVFFLYCWIC